MALFVRFMDGGISLERGVKGGLADFHACGRLAHGEAGRNELAGAREPFGRGGSRPATLSAPGRGRREPCIRPFADQIPLELAESAKDVEC